MKKLTYFLILVLVSCKVEPAKVGGPVASLEIRSGGTTIGSSRKPPIPEREMSKDHTYKIDISTLSSSEKHLSYSNLQEFKGVQSLFQNSFSKQMKDEEMKTMDVVLRDYVGIFKLYAKNQVELIYMVDSLTESMRESSQDRDFSQDYYYPYQYAKYGIQNDFENISMLSYFLSSACFRPVQAQLSEDTTKLSIAVQLQGLPVDTQRAFGDIKVINSINFPSHCSMDISSIIKKMKDIQLDDENRRLDVVSKISDDGKTQILTIEPTEREKLKAYFGNPILIMDSDQGEWRVRSVPEPELTSMSASHRQTVHVCLGQTD